MANACDRKIPARDKVIPFSIIRTMTVGLGITPSLLTLLKKPEEFSWTLHQALAG
jgi:hypothetical protein